MYTPSWIPDLIRILNAAKKKGIIKFEDKLNTDISIDRD